MEEMKLDAASHLLRRPISFELFLVLYLMCALVLQMVNIYKTVSPYCTPRMYGVHYLETTPSVDVRPL